MATERTITSSPSGAKSIATLATGTLLGYGIAAALAPALSRLLTPSAFGAFTLYSAFCNTLLTIACLRYDAAILVPRRDYVARTLARTAVISVVLVSTALLCAVYLAPAALLVTLGVQVVPSLLWVAPASVLVGGLLQALSTWAVRQRSFRAVGVSRAVALGGGTLTQLFLSLLWPGPLALVSGDLIGRAAAAKLVLRATAAGPAKIHYRLLWRIAKRFWRFPLLNTWAALLNALTLQIPFLMLATAFDATVVGLYGLAHRMLTLPMTLFGQAFGQLFASRISGLPTGSALATATGDGLVAVFCVTLPVFVFVHLSGESLFRVGFGAEWAKSGEMASLLAPWFLLWAVTSPVSSVFTVQQRHGLQLGLTGIELILRIVAVGVGTHLGSPTTTIALLACAGATNSAVVICLLLRLSGAPYRPVIRRLGALLAIMAAASCPALVTIQFVERTDMDWTQLTHDAAIVGSALTTSVAYLLLLRKLRPDLLEVVHRALIK